MENGFRNNKIFSVLSLILGIFSILCSCQWYVGGLLALGAIALFIISKCLNHFVDGIAICGLVCGIIGLIISVICLLSQTVFIEQFQDLYYSIFEKLI